MGCPLKSIKEKKGETVPKVRGSAKRHSEQTERLFAPKISRKGYKCGDHQVRWVP